MKKTILLLSIAFVAFVGCNKNDNGQLDPNAMVSIRPETNTRTSENPEHLSALEIVKQTTVMRQGIGARAFGGAQVDTINVRLLMWGTDIISTEGKYVSSFIESRGTVFERDRHIDGAWITDTIAYIKNSTLDLAEEQIKAAHAKQDLKACYEIFDKAFTFVPINGAEYRALEAKGEN